MPAARYRSRDSRGPGYRPRGRAPDLLRKWRLGVPPRASDDQPSTSALTTGASARLAPHPWPDLCGLSARRLAPAPPAGPNRSSPRSADPGAPPDPGPRASADRPGDEPDGFHVHRAGAARFGHNDEAA